MAPAWQLAMATAKLFLSVAIAASASQHEASERVRAQRSELSGPPAA
jgi:hypothetical protein